MDVLAPDSGRQPLVLVRCCAALMAALAVAMGAYAAHGMRATASAEAVAVVQTAVQYQMWHALALLGLALLPDSRWRQWAAGLFLAGIALFCGSLYVLSFTPLRPGLLTPLGGLLLMAGWLSVLLAVPGRWRAGSRSQ